MWATWTMDAPRGGGQPEGCPSGAPATRHFHSPSAAGRGGWTEAVVLRLYGGIPAGPGSGGRTIALREVPLGTEPRAFDCQPGPATDAPFKESGPTPGGRRPVAAHEWGPCWVTPHPPSCVGVVAVEFAAARGQRGLRTRPVGGER